MAQTNANLIWQVAELLRGPYQPNQYGDVILPFTPARAGILAGDDRCDAALAARS
jgi:hypothetical protein